MSGVYAQSFDYTSIAPHPRILLPAGGETEIKAAIAENTSLGKVHDMIIDSCAMFMMQAPVTHVKEGKRLLAVSRTALQRIYYLSYAYRMTGDGRYAARAEREMLAASAFHDWNPTHFLDVGEMVMALAIGYDWLYDVLSEESKRTVREAILEKGFLAAENTKNAWFYKATNNWNQVCNAGLVYGALAVFDQEPEAAVRIIEKCIETNPKAMACYAPDGGYPEGYMYWGYGTSFQILLIAALESAFGTDCGLSDAPGFLRSARFMLHMTGPSGDSFCYGDAPRDAYCNVAMFWCASKLADPSVLWVERGYLDKENVRFAEHRLLPSLLIFASGVDFKEIRKPSQDFWSNRGETPVYTYRSGWESPDDAWLALKGGSAQTSHAHMDAGSFVYEHGGVRWAMDLGMQEYITLESRGVDLWNQKQDGQRWDVFRWSNRNHNTLTVNGHRHNASGVAEITHTFTKKNKKGAVVDLSEILDADLKKAVRTITLDGRDQLTVNDRLTARKADAAVMWVMVTPADARITGPDTIELAKDGKTMLLTVAAKHGAEMKIWSNVPTHDYDEPNPGTIRVGFETVVPAGKTVEIEVKLTPKYK